MENKTQTSGIQECLKTHLKQSSRSTAVFSRQNAPLLHKTVTVSFFSADFCVKWCKIATRDTLLQFTDCKLLHFSCSPPHPSKKPPTRPTEAHLTMIYVYNFSIYVRHIEADTTDTAATYKLLQNVSFLGSR